MLILTNSGLAYNVYHIKIIEDALSSADNLNISSQKGYGYFIIEQKQLQEHSFRQKDLSTKFNLKTLKLELKIKSHTIPSIFIRKYNVEIKSKNIFKDFLHTFPFHFFY